MRRDSYGVVESPAGLASTRKSSADCPSVLVISASPCASVGHVLQKAGEHVGEFGLVPMPVEESIFRTGHLQTKLLVLRFPFINLGMRPSNSSGFFRPECGIYLDTLKFLGSSPFLLGFVGIVFGFAWDIPTR